MNETLRQVVHLLLGLLIAGMIWVLGREISTLILAVGIFFGLMVADAVLRGYFVPFFSPILGMLERTDAVPGKGAFFFTLSALFCLLIFEMETVVIAIIVLSLLDSLSTIIGMRWGKIRIYNGKSVEGSLAGAIASLAAIHFLLPLEMAVIVACAAGIVELVSPVDDNLTIPVSVCVILSLPLTLIIP
jgi:phytol kinase